MTAAEPASFATTEFVGFDFAQASLDDVLAWLARRTAASRFAYVVTPNVDHVVRFQKSAPEIRRTYTEADLCVCDSRVLARIGRFYGLRLPVVPGSDLVARAVGKLYAAGERICLIGGTPGMAAELEALHPGLTIIQHLAPMGLLSDPTARADAIAAAAGAKARVTLLAVGSPQQELLAWEIRRSGEVSGTGLCIGASVDFLVGRQSRAPRAIQRAGMEWAWRLATQPRRLWRRYLIEGPAIFAIARRWAMLHRNSQAGARRG